VATTPSEVYVTGVQSSPLPASEDDAGSYRIMNGVACPWISLRDISSRLGETPIVSANPRSTQEPVCAWAPKPHTPSDGPFVNIYVVPTGSAAEASLEDFGTTLREDGGTQTVETLGDGARVTQRQSVVLVMARHGENVFVVLVSDWPGTGAARTAAAARELTTLMLDRWTG
jgi:hypothetical protein